MRSCRLAAGLVVACCILVLTVRALHSQGKYPNNAVQVHIVVTDQALNDDREVPVLRQDNVQVKVGKDNVKVEHVIPAQGDSAALQLFLLIDDTCEPTAIGSNLNDLRDFIGVQPASTVVGVGYMSNATVQLAQNFTADHALAGKAIRLPRGTSSAMDSPYLSLVSLVKGWPQQKLRREVLIISDGIDRLRGDTTGDLGPTNPFATSGPRSRIIGAPASSTMPSISSDADTASQTSQRYGVIVHSIYATGVGRLSRNGWEAQLGQGGIAKVTDETGGEYFALGTQNAVSFKPYLERLQKILENQYFLVFLVAPRNKGGLQRVRISTNEANADIAAADNVWVPASGG